jgi:hypothetical protein
MPNHFLLFVQKKAIKENHTPLPLISFDLSASSGRLRNSPANYIQAKTFLAAFHLPLKPKARQKKGGG